MSKIKLALVGVGYWGSKLLRVFSGFEQQCEIVAVVDTESSRLKELPLSPSVRRVATIQEAFLGGRIDAVAIATPATSHFELVRFALNHGAHVFVEKPLAVTSADAAELAQIAIKNRRVLMVGHIFHFHPAIKKLRALADRGAFDRLLQLRSVRANHGPLRNDVGALWDLAVHDISIFQALRSEHPVSVSCTVANALGRNAHDSAQGVLNYADGSCATFYVSWLEPTKRRELILVGERAMAVYDEAVAPSYITIQRRWTELLQEGCPQVRFEGEERLDLGAAEPLAAECRAFIEAAEKGWPDAAQLTAAIEIVRILEALEGSARNGGGPVSLSRNREAGHG